MTIVLLQPSIRCRSTIEAVQKHIYYASAYTHNPIIVTYSTIVILVQTYCVDLVMRHTLLIVLSHNVQMFTGQLSLFRQRLLQNGFSHFSNRSQHDTTVIKRLQKFTSHAHFEFQSQSLSLNARARNNS